MTTTIRQLVARRLAGQRLIAPEASRASDVVRALGAVQAQDFAGAKWAVAQRTQGLTDADVEREFAAGDLLRTHVLRPTWHFVAPADIRWMLALTAPRVKAAMTYYDRVLELDAKVYRRSNAAIEKALAGGKHLTRAELAAALEAAGVKITSGQRLGHLMMQAELDAVVCSGARRGKQHTYALLDERVPPTPPLDRDEALIRLTRLYFSTRGPATARDFSWWSGLTLADAKRGVEMAGRELEHLTLDGADYWSTDRALPRATPAAMLLPNYDEFFIGYKDRGAIATRLGDASTVIGGNALITHVLFVNGQLVGTWKRLAEKSRVVVQIELGCKLSTAELGRVAAAARRFEAFLASPLDIKYRGRFS